MRTNWRAFQPWWNQLQEFQGEMNRLFDRWGVADRSANGMAFPAVNVWENGEQVFVEAELAGLDLKGLEIYVTGGNQLTIKGERKVQLPEKAIRHRQERGFGKFSRVLTLPFAVDAEKVEARLEHGVLDLKLAKHESAKPRKIHVKGE